jgi:hypothetical protein
MKERTLLLTAALLSGVNGGLRGNDVHEIATVNGASDPQRLVNQRRLPDKKDLQKLKRINAERKQKNKQTREKKKQDQDDGDDEEWKSLTKIEKKKLIKELREEEKAKNGGRVQGGSGKKDKGDGDGEKGGVRDQVKPNQLAYLQQYFHSLDGNDMEMNSAIADDNSNEDVEWKDLTKEEKKRVKEMMDGDLAIKDMVANSSSGGDGWKDLSKQEKKELLKGQGDGADEEDITQNSSQADKDSEANDFVIHNRPKPGTLTVDDIMGHNSQNGKDEEDMTQNSQQATNNAASNFVLPMPSLTYGNEEDQDSASNTFVNGGNQMNQNSQGANSAAKNDPECPNCFAFASQLYDPSIQLDSFDPSPELNWSMSGQGWNTISQDCYEGTSCIASGITSTPDHQGGAVHSDLTLHLDSGFDGGVLTFQVKVKDELEMPNEAFYVSVDGEVKLSPLSFGDDWAEYSVSVGKGEHTVTWSHVYNPLELESLPTANTGGLTMDDLRYSPFERIKSQGFEDNKDKGLIMTSDGDAVWKIDNEERNSGSYSILASTKDIGQDSGSSNVNFVLYSEEGGTLKYKISTSTTAPHDDFVVLLNGQPVDSVFGLMPSFEYESLDIPMGKVAVTFQHRKNPGKLSESVLGALGTVRTKGFTRVDDVRFEPK